MGKKEGKDMFVLVFPLKVEKWQEDQMDKILEHLRYLYNHAQGKLQKQYNYFSQMQEYKACATKTAKGKFFENHPFYISGINKPITFTEYGFITYFCELIKKNLSSGKSYTSLGFTTPMAMSLSSHLWSAWDKLLYGRGKKVSYKKRGELNSFSVRRIGKIFCGLSLNIPAGEVKIKLDERPITTARTMTLRIDNAKPTEYDMCALENCEDRLRVIGIVRKQIRGRYRFYLQLSMEGTAPTKNKILGDGIVGIDPGISTMAVVSNTSASIDTLLTDKCIKLRKELTLIEQKIERSRRTTNPQNFTEDGQIKRMKKGERRVWHCSKNYIKLSQRKKELNRKLSEMVRLSHNKMTNELLPLGNVFITEDMDYAALAKRAKGIRKRKDGKTQSNKRYGKSISMHAPSLFLSILERKVTQRGGKFHRVNTRNAASQFDFTNGTFTRHERNERFITLSDGHIHQRDMLSAFNLQHVNPDVETLKDYDVEQMIKDYDSFCCLENEEKERYKKGIKKSRKYTVGF